MENAELNKLNVVGDRVLIKPFKLVEKTCRGLYLSSDGCQKKKIYRGYVINVGPCYPIPALNDIDESWKANKADVRYVPLQPKPGDMAVYLQNRA